MKNSVLFLTIFTCFVVQGKSLHRQPISSASTLRYPHEVREFYYRKHTRLFWFATGSAAPELRDRLWRCIDSARYHGLDSSRYHYTTIRNNRSGISARIIDSVAVNQLDQIFTDAAIIFCKDLSQGIDLYDRLRYDELSARSASAGDRQLLDKLIAVTSAAGLNSLLTLLEPSSAEYLALKIALSLQLDSNSQPLKIRMLASSLDYYRWIDHFAFNKYILVNIASATLKYYDSDSLVLAMKIVAGKPSTPTPRFSARCTGITLYPYWNVPHRIAVTELLPLFRTTPALLDEMGMQIINAGGNVVDYHSLPWFRYSKNYFPYRIRQVTGCGNSLGVVKFELTDPFNVYMHDTNLKSAFSSASRYYSHGCIRLEKPYQLALALLGNQLDTTLLIQCLKDQQPIRLGLKKPVPVLVVYMTAEAGEDGKTVWYKDSYHLLTKK